MPPRRAFRPAAWPCPVSGCKKKPFKSERSLRLHYEAVHAVPVALALPPPREATSPPSTPETQESSPEPDEGEQATQVSPTFSSHRSPRRTPSGSPLRSPHMSPRFSPTCGPSLPGGHSETQTDGIFTEYHPVLDGTPCDIHGNDLDPGSKPRPRPTQSDDNYTPFLSRAEFEFAEFLFTEDQMSGQKIDKLMNILDRLYTEQPPPFSDHKELYSIIDSIQQGNVPWNSFTVAYNGPRPQNTAAPPWMDEKYEVWFRDPLQVLEGQLGNTELNGKIDIAPKRMFRKVAGVKKRRFRDLMSGNWSWEEADKIAVDEATHGAMLVPVIAGSDKTTVSVATGQNDFYPLYASIGNAHNSVRRAHKDAVALIGFLAIPKTTKEFADKADFRKFRRQLFHSSLEHIFSSLRPHMTKPRVTLCCDGHYRRVIYSLGPYIADYPEQALLSCIVQNWCPKCTAPPQDLDGGIGGPRSHKHSDTLLKHNSISLKELWDDYGIVGDLLPFTTAFPRADIHELLSPDLLHQIIKGTFKDHLVDWIDEYIKATNTKAQAEAILADIDRRIAAVPSFPGLRHFHQGRGFKQWTGNDSKGLMKVYLPAISGHLPKEMVRAVAALIEFCYLVRRDTIDEDALSEIKSALARFHEHREIFRDLDVRPEGFSLPRQHSLAHYPYMITQFGAPNGLCSSITESKHIKAVKKPYRRSSKNKPLGQMLVTNQRLDKIAAARVDFASRGMLNGPSTLDKDLMDGLLGGPRESGMGSAVPVVPTRNQTARAAEDRENIEFGAVIEPEALAEIELAKTHVRRLPRNIHELALKLHQPNLPLLTRRYLYNDLHPDSPTPADSIPADELPEIPTNVRIYNSARVVFYAPSDLSGAEGLRHERIWSTKSWYGSSRRDCVFVGNSDSNEPGFRGLLVARVFLFFSFLHHGKRHRCALVQWFSTVGDSPCDETGMWMVEPDFHRRNRLLEVIHLDSILRGAHLIGVAGPHFLPSDPTFHFSKSLDAFKTFYVNKYADHQAHEIAF